MKAVERILLTTDLAPHSDRATERAVLLAAQFRADLAVLYAVQPFNGQPASAFDRMSSTAIEAEVRRHLAALPLAASLSPLVIIQEGPVEDVIASFAALWNPDLMVAGAHRSDTIKDLFSVSTVERISIASPAPLLVVRNKPFGAYSSALVPVDFLDTSRSSVEASMFLVPEGAIHLLHVLDIPGKVASIDPSSVHGLEADFDALLKDMNVGRRVIGTSVRYGSAMQEIIEVSYLEMPELIVMGTVGRRGIGRALLGSTAHEVLEHLPSDVLLVRAE